MRTPGKITHALSFAAILAVGITVGAVPAVRSLSTFRALTVEQEQLAEELTRMTALESAKAEAEAEVARLLAEIQAAEALLEPTPFASASLHRALNALASEHGVTLAEVTPKPPRENPHCAEIPFSVRARAPFPKLHAFIDGLEALERTTQLERLSISALPDAQACDVDLTVVLIASEDGGGGDGA